MYPSNQRRMCNTPREELHESDYTTRIERSPSTGSKERITRFKDGSSIWHGGMGGPDMHFDEYGEEC
jgi:hypothetical protein